MRIDPSKCVACGNCTYVCPMGAIYIDPAMVHKDRLEAGNGKNGVEGDPRHASAEIGRMLTMRTIDRTLDAIKKSIAAH